MIAAVFDTNIYLQAILSEDGPARACVQLVLDDVVELITTGEIIAEVLRVIARPALVTKYPQLQGERSLLLVLSIFRKAKMATTPGRTFVFERDSADEVFINLALETDADVLVSRDRDLLDWAIDAGSAAKLLKLRIVSPVGFLEIVRAL